MTLRKSGGTLVLAFGIPLVTAVVLVVWLLRLPGQERVIAAFSTGIKGRTESQIHNVCLALAALDGKEIPPGKVFSFNRTIGPWTVDRGYRKAPVSFSGDKLLDWGGGVCQASTTLYNAALLAGLPILERNRHHWPASYVPPGQDAAVAYPGIDLRFRNSLAAPIHISARIAGSSVLVQLSSRQAAPPVTLERKVLAVTEPATLIRYEPNRIRHHTVRGQLGYQVALYRTLQGERPKRELISRDTYPPQNRIIWRR